MSAVSGSGSRGGAPGELTLWHAGRNLVERRPGDPRAVEAVAVMGGLVLAIPGAAPAARLSPTRGNEPLVDHTRQLWICSPTG